MGGSPRNALAKWQEKEPNGYLAVTGYETHNGYIYVLAGTGVIGMLTIVIFMILYARKMILYMKGNYHIPPEDHNFPRQFLPRNSRSGVPHNPLPRS